MTTNLLFISMLGEREHFNPELFSGLCDSGLERDWIVEWHGKLAAMSGLEMSSVDICRGDTLLLVDEVSHGGNWFSGQFHPDSMKGSWDIYYGELESDYSSSYSTDHHD